MKLRLPRRRFWRALIYIVCLLLVVVAADLLLVQTRRRISPGYFTTRIEAPLREDGRIDYLTALENYFGDGVTPDNNAAPLLLLAFGREALPRTQPDDGITNRLGMQHLPKEGRYYVRYEDWCKAHAAQQEDDPTDPSDAIHWPLKVSASTEQWIKDNERPLELIIEASKKPRYFMPFNGGNRTWTILEVLIPHVRFIAEVHRPLLTRALLRLQQGDVAGFRQDLFAVHRLARLAGSAPTLVERLAAVTQLEIAACHAQRAAALSGKLSSAELKSIAAELSEIGDLPSMRDGVNIGERYMGLDVMQSLAQLSPLQSARMLDQLQNGRPGMPVALMSLVPIPYEKAMRSINAFHDGALAATQLSNYPQRMEALDRCEKSLAPAAEHSEFVKRLSGDWAAAYLLPAVVRAYQRSDVAHMERDLSRIALALAAFKIDHQDYPASLDELVPGYLRAVPLDVFSDKPLSYVKVGAGYKLYSIGPNMHDDDARTGKPADDLPVVVP
jgi:hypothetical protein